MAGFENMAGFRPGPGPDTKSGATLISSITIILVIVVAILGVPALELPQNINIKITLYCTTK